jgi:hypothetical protein
MVTEIVWPHVLCIQLWLLVLLLTLCASRELIRSLGKERLLELFLTSRRDADAAALSRLSARSSRPRSQAD